MAVDASDNCVTNMTGAWTVESIGRGKSRRGRGDDGWIRYPLLARSTAAYSTYFNDITHILHFLHKGT
jgi:hypothetical protein